MINAQRGDWWRRAFFAFCLLGAILPRDASGGLVRGGRNPLPENWVWPTQKVIVPALVAPLGARTGWSIPSWLNATGSNTSIYTFQTSHPNSPHYAQTSEVGLENMPYFRFIIDYYDRLPEYTVFVHNDVYSHNPHWLHWLECLRTDRVIPWASLSPNYVSQRADEGGMGADLFYKAFMNSTEERIDPPRNRTFPCCELWLMHRSTIRRWPKGVYVELMEGLIAHKIKARVFEYGLHYAMLGNSLLGRIHRPCQIYKCWCEGCRKAKVGMFYFSWHQGFKIGFAGKYYFSSFGTSEKIVDLRVQNMCKSTSRFCGMVNARSLFKTIQSCKRPPPPQTELDKWDKQLTSWPINCDSSDRRCSKPSNRFSVEYFPDDDPWKAYSRTWPARDD